MPTINYTPIERRKLAGRPRLDAPHTMAVFNFKSDSTDNPSPKLSLADIRGPEEPGR